MIRKIVTLLIVLILSLLLFVGCSNEADIVHGEKEYRVAFIARSQEDTFAEWFIDEMKIAAEAYPDIKLDVFDGKGDNETENAEIEKAISENYDAIIVQPNLGEEQRAYVEKIVEAGIIAITTNSNIEGIEGASSVDVDPYMQAKVNAEAALSIIPENANVVIIKGPAGNLHADERYKAWKEIFFKERNDVTIVGEDFGNWEKESAKKIMEKQTSDNQRIDAVIAMNDSMAIGALEAVENNPIYADILSFGVDGTPEACLLIKEGKLTSTCLQSAIELAELNMKSVHELLTGEKKRLDEEIRVTVVNKINVGKYLDIYLERGLISQADIEEVESEAAAETGIDEENVENTEISE